MPMPPPADAFRDVSYHILSALPAARPCRKCGRPFSPDAFYRDNHKGGYRTLCKRCTKAACGAYYKRHRSEIKGHNAAWNDAHPQAMLEMVLRLHADGAGAKREHAAHMAVAWALRAGRLVMPDTCDRCGNNHALLDAHHADYDHPLSLTTLCRSCHKRLHRARVPCGEEVALETR